MRKGREQREHCIRRMIASGGREDGTSFPMGEADDDEDAGVVGTESDADEWRWLACGECGDGASMRNNGRSGNNAGELYKKYRIFMIVGEFIHWKGRGFA